LRSLTPPVPPADLAERITSRTVTKRLYRPRRRRRVVVPLALAACLLVALAVRLYWSRRPADPAPGPGPLVKQPQAPAEPVNLRGSVDQAREAVVALTTRTADEAVGQARWLLPQVPTPSREAPAAPLEPPVRTLRQAGAGVGAGLEPVAGSARRAVDRFLRDLPVDLGGGL
jgi:hypothetical protein